MHHIHAPHTPTNTHVHHQTSPKHKIYIVGLPSVLYETPGLNERSVLNQLFLLLFSVAFHEKYHFSQKAQHFSWKVQRFSYKVLWAFGWSPSIGLFFERPNSGVRVCFQVVQNRSKHTWFLKGSEIKRKIMSCNFDLINKPVYCEREVLRTVEAKYYYTIACFKLY